MPFSKGNLNPDDLLVSKGNQLHQIMIKVTILYGIAFSIVNYVTKRPEELVISLCLIPICLIAWFLFLNGYTLISKLLAISLIMADISLVSLIVSPATFVLSFFMPILIGILIIFQGKEKRIGYVFCIFGLGVLLFLLTTKIVILSSRTFTPDELRIDQSANLIGASFMCILQVLFIMQVGNSIQGKLIESGSNLSKTNKMLQSMVRNRESMMSILSHDLRTPLTLIISALDLIRPGRFPLDQMENLIEKVSNRSRGTLLLLDSLILWSRQLSEDGKTEMETVLLHDLGIRLKSFYALLYSEKEVFFELDFPKSMKVSGNASMLDTIFRNLVSNSFKFTPVGGKIKVSAEAIGNSCKFTIEDNGRGMSPEALLRIRNGIGFSTEGVENEKGNGLGIQIVRDFILRLNTSIEVNSELGQGTSFSFTLPLA